MLDQIAFIKLQNAESLISNESKFKDDISEVKVQLIQRENELDELKKNMELERTIATSNLAKIENMYKKQLENLKYENDDLNSKYEKAGDELLNLQKQHAKVEKEITAQLYAADIDLKDCKALLDNARF